jgi:thymidylate kinase
MGILISRSIHFVTNKIMPEHRSTTICLLGPDGSGKSTLAKDLKQNYQRFFQKFNPGIKMVYFGWKPFLPTTKLLSLLLKKKKYNIVEKNNKIKKNVMHTVFQSLLFSYFFIEYLARYIWIILPLRDEKKIIILDRYFYDLFAHYQHASQSRWFCLLLKKFPQPDFIFLLDVPVEELLQRKQELPKEQLLQHQQKYHQLQKVIPLTAIDTTMDIEHSRNEIISKTWKLITRRLT